MIKQVFGYAKKALTVHEQIGESRFRNTERMLYGYPILDKEIRLLEEQIERFTKNPDEFGYEYGRKSKDVVRFMSGGGSVAVLSCWEAASAGFETAAMLLDEKKANFERLVDSIMCIADNDYFEYVELYYFQRKSDESIAKLFDTYQRLVNRRRRRLVECLAKIIFEGVDIH